MGILSGFLSGDDEYLLFHGDASDILDIFPDASVDCCVTSPPYWRQRSYSESTGLGCEADLEDYVKHLVDILNKLKRILKPQGSLWLNIGDTYKDKNLMGVPWRVAFALQNSGWILRNAVIWDKVKGNPCNAKDKLRNMYEYIFHFVTRDMYYYDVDAVREPPRKPYYRNGKIVTPTGVSGERYRRQILSSTDLNDDEKKRALKALDEALGRVESGEILDFRMVIRGVQRTTHSDSPEYSGRAEELRKYGFYILPYHRLGPKPGDIWHIVPENTIRRDRHFAVFPKALCEIPIKATCPPKGIVLDPFVGTGTTVVAALELGRRGIGIDISEEYLNVARERIRQVIASPKSDDVQLSFTW